MQEPLHQDLLDPWLGPWLKGFPHGAAPLRRSQVAAQGWNVWRGDLPLPLAVIKQPQLAHNLRWMQDFVDGQGISFAPHGKTTMSPQLFDAQLRQGAWGITVATIAQLRVAVQSGVRNALIANQVLQAQDLVEVARLLAETPGLRVVFLLDSLDQLRMIESLGLTAAFEVLVEVGVPGGRTVGWPLSRHVASWLVCWFTRWILGVPVKDSRQTESDDDPLRPGLDVNVARGHLDGIRHDAVHQLEGVDRSRVAAPRQVAGGERGDGGVRGGEGGLAVGIDRGADEPPAECGQPAA
jgi:hypothetical protein